MDAKEGLRSSATITAVDANGNEFRKVPLVFCSERFATIRRTCGREIRRKFFKSLKKVPDKHERAVPSEIAVWLAALAFSELAGCYGALVQDGVPAEEASNATFVLFGDTVADLMEQNTVTLKEVGDGPVQSATDGEGGEDAPGEQEGAACGAGDGTDTRSEPEPE